MLKPRLFGPWCLGRKKLTLGNICLLSEVQIHVKHKYLKLVSYQGSPIKTQSEIPLLWILFIPEDRRLCKYSCHIAVIGGPKRHGLQFTAFHRRVYPGLSPTLIFSSTYFIQRIKYKQSCVLHHPQHVIILIFPLNTDLSYLKWSI